MNFGKVIKHNILIEASGNYGFIVTVGCGKFAFRDVKGLLEGLEEYLYDPVVSEERYNKNNPPGPQPVEERLVGTGSDTNLRTLG